MQALLSTVFLAFLNLKDVIYFMLIYERFWEIENRVCFVCIFSVIFNNYRLVTNKILFN